MPAVADDLVPGGKGDLKHHTPIRRTHNRDPERDLGSDWRGADLVVDAVGHESALAAAFPLVRMGGSISMPGMYVEDTAPMPIGEMWLKNITLFAGVANVQAHMDEVIELIRHGRLDPKVIISHRLPLSEAAKGYQLFDQKEALKVVLDPSA